MAQEGDEVDKGVRVLLTLGKDAPEPTADNRHAWQVVAADQWANMTMLKAASASSSSAGSLLGLSPDSVSVVYASHVLQSLHYRRSSQERQALLVVGCYRRKQRACFACVNDGLPHAQGWMTECEARCGTGTQY